jgi:hypothetical protein
VHLEELGHLLDGQQGGIIRQSRHLGTLRAYYEGTLPVVVFPVFINRRTRDYPCMYCYNLL